MKYLFILNDPPYGTERSYDALRLARDMLRKGDGLIGACGTCLDARGIAADDLVEGVHRGTLDELTEWTLWSDKELVF